VRGLEVEGSCPPSPAKGKSELRAKRPGGKVLVSITEAQHTMVEAYL
jgi:hypothetical protein